MIKFDDALPEIVALLRLPLRELIVVAAPLYCAVVTLPLRRLEAPVRFVELEEILTVEPVYDVLAAAPGDTVNASAAPVTDVVEVVVAFCMIKSLTVSVPENWPAPVTSRATVGAVVLPILRFPANTLLSVELL